MMHEPSFSAEGAAREERRVASVGSYNLAGAQLATGLADQLRAYAAFARDVTGAQFAAINIIDATRQFTIAGTAGPDALETDRSSSMCARILYATGAGEVYVTGDASADPSLQSSPWVTGELASVRFYIGAALIGREGLPLGMLCVGSSEPLTREAADLASQRLLPIRQATMELLNADRTEREDLAAPHDLDHEFAGLVLDEQRRSIDSIIEGGQVRTLFQPVVHLATGAVVGFEALSRGPAGSALESPLALFHAAATAGRIGELDWVCRISAMQAAVNSRMPRNVSWFINVEPDGLDVECPDHLRAALDHARGHLRVVLEVVERGLENQVTRLIRCTDEARRDGWGIALDDVGARPESLALLPFLQPDVVKLDMSLLRHSPTEAVAEITSAVRAYAEQTGAAILAEGIETAEQEELAKVFGATYGQGYLFGRPGPLPTPVATVTHPVPLRQQPHSVTGATPFEVLNASIPSSRANAKHLLHIVEHLEQSSEHATEAGVLLAQFAGELQFRTHRVRMDALARRNAISVCVVGALGTDGEDPRYHFGPDPDDCLLQGESAMIVVGPHHQGALITRVTGLAAADGAPLVDYIYTHDRPAIIAAGRAFLDRLTPVPATAYAPSRRSGGHPRHAESLFGRWRSAHTKVAH